MYKEKYLKYKTKYLDLKNQLDSNYNIIQDGGKYNIIQDGGCNSAGIKGICDPYIKLTYDNMKEQDRLNKVSLENTRLKVIDYVKKINCHAKTIIINPTPAFYKENDISPYEIDMNILEKDKSFIILTSPIDLCEVDNIVVGLLVNYEDENKFFIIEYVNGWLVCKTCDEILHRLNQYQIFLINQKEPANKEPAYSQTSNFIVNISNLLKLFNECIYHIKDMQKEKQIKKENAEQIETEIKNIMKRIEKICNDKNYTYNLHQVITLGEYIRDLS